MFFFFFLFLLEILQANSVDPDQMLHFAASDLGLHCLPMSRKRDARHEWVKSDNILYLYEIDC